MLYFDQLNVIKKLNDGRYKEALDLSLEYLYTLRDRYRNKNVPDIIPKEYSRVYRIYEYSLRKYTKYWNEVVWPTMGKKSIATK